jgi:1-acyl-sn-glycerol-3-phosphate acyltransferase
MVNSSSGFIAKSSLKKIPGLSWWLYVIGCEFLDRKPSKKEIKTIKRITTRLSEGASFFLFPEGTRTRTGLLGEFKSAVIHILKKSKPTIVPVAIKGSFSLLPPGRFWVSSTEIEIIFGRPYFETTLSEEILNEINAWFNEQITIDLIEKTDNNSSLGEAKQILAEV